MILRSSPASPFARKVRIALDLVGLASQVRVENADTSSDDDALGRQNPLGKVPTLILDDGTAVFDSAVIIDELDARVPGVLVPAGPEARRLCLVAQALADGLMEATLLIFYEARWRDAESRSARWVGHHEKKVARTLAVLETAPPTGPVDAGHVATACALGYLDLRAGGAWRTGHPALVAWLDGFAATVPSFEATRFSPPA